MCLGFLLLDFSFTKASIRTLCRMFAKILATKNLYAEGDFFFLSFFLARAQLDKLEDEMLNSVEAERLRFKRFFSRMVTFSLLPYHVTRNLTLVKTLSIYACTYTKKKSQLCPTKFDDVFLSRTLYTVAV